MKKAFPLEKDEKSEAIRYWWEKSLESLEATRRDLAAEAFSFAIDQFISGGSGAHVAFP